MNKSKKRQRRKVNKYQLGKEITYWSKQTPVGEDWVQHWKDRATRGRAAASKSSTWNDELKKVENQRKTTPKPSPLTFAGRVTLVITDSPSAAKTADVVSSVVLLSPYGFIPAAMDLGYDLSRTVHEEDGAVEDSGLDLLSMIPFINKLGLKSPKTKTILDMLKYKYDNILLPVRSSINSVLKNGRYLDFVDDAVIPNVMLHKSGSKIHIKKKNRGKFTKYCHGKVTDACIRRAKASGNPTLVKRATFADNARHFKHRSGGLIVQEFKLRRILNNIINN